MLAQIGMVLLRPKKCSGTGYGDADLTYWQSSLMTFIWKLQRNLVRAGSSCIISAFLLRALFLFDLVVPHCLEKCRPAVMLPTRWDPTHPTCISETLAMCVWSSRPNFSTWSWESRKFDLKPAQLISINHPNPNYFHQLDQPVLDQILAWHSYLEALTKELGMVYSECSQRIRHVGSEKSKRTENSDG